MLLVILLNRYTKVSHVTQLTESQEFSLQSYKVKCLGGGDGGNGCTGGGDIDERGGV